MNLFRTASRAVYWFLWLILCAMSARVILVPADTFIYYPLFPPVLVLIHLTDRLTMDTSSSDFRWELLAFGVMTFTPLFGWKIHNAWTWSAIVPQWLCAIFLIVTAQHHYQTVIEHATADKDRILQSRKELETARKENNFYTERIRHLNSQIGERQKIALFAREMGTLLDPEKIREKLLQKTSELFPEDNVTVRTASTSDPLDTWVSERKIPLLVKDIAQDSRFKGQVTPGQSGSAITVPLLIERNVAGAVRVESSHTGRFSETDLQQLELYAHMAVLSLGNAQLFSRVNSLATRDPLTGLATHRAFQEQLVDEILRSARYRNVLSLIMLDVDHFKQVNDQYGHLAGDQVLREVSRMLSNRCRPVDFAARYGGEEFTLILPQLDINEAVRTAESLRLEISSRAIAFQDQTLKITVSIGCASFPLDAQISSQLIRKADERLYTAKRSGRNQVVYT